MLQPLQGDKKVMLGTKEAQFCSIGDRSSNFGCSLFSSGTCNISSGSSQLEPVGFLPHPDLCRAFTSAFGTQSTFCERQPQTRRKENLEAEDHCRDLQCLPSCSQLSVEVRAFPQTQAMKPVFARTNEERQNRVAKLT